MAGAAPERAPQPNPTEVKDIFTQHAVSTEQVWSNVTNFPRIDIRGTQIAGEYTQNAKDLRRKYGIEARNPEQPITASDLVTFVGEPAVLQQMISEALRMRLVTEDSLRQAGVKLETIQQAGVAGADLVTQTSGIKLAEDLDYLDRATVLGVVIQKLNGNDGQVRYLDSLNEKILGQQVKHTSGRPLNELDLLNSLAAASQEAFTKYQRGMKYVEASANISRARATDENSGILIPRTVTLPENEDFVQFLGLTNAVQTRKVVEADGVTRVEAELMESAATDLRVGKAQLIAFTDAKDLLEMEKLAIQAQREPDPGKRVAIGERIDQFRRNAIIRIMSAHNVEGYRELEERFEQVRSTDPRQTAASFKNNFLTTQSEFVARMHQLENQTLLEANRQALTNMCTVLTGKSEAPVKAVVERQDWSRTRLSTIIRKYQGNYPANIAEQLMWEDIYQSFLVDLRKGDGGTITPDDQPALRNFFVDRVKLENGLLADRQLNAKPEHNPEVLTLRKGQVMGLKGNESVNIMLNLALVGDELPSYDRFLEEVERAGQAVPAARAAGAEMRQVSAADKVKIAAERAAVGLPADASDKEYAAARAAVDQKAADLGLQAEEGKAFTKAQADAAEAQMNADAAALKVEPGANLKETADKVRDARGKLNAEAVKWGVADADKVASVAELNTKLDAAKAENARVASVLNLPDPANATPDAVRAALQAAAGKYGVTDPNPTLDMINAAKANLAGEAAKYGVTAADPSAAEVARAKADVVRRAKAANLPDPGARTLADVEAAERAKVGQQKEVIKAKGVANATALDLANLDKADVDPLQVAAEMEKLRKKHRILFLKNTTAEEKRLEAAGGDNWNKYQQLRRLSA